MTFGSVPDRLENLVLETPFLQISADRTCRLGSPPSPPVFDPVEVVRSLLLRAAVESIRPQEIRNFVLGPVLGLLCHQRGVIPLHAAAVSVGGAALALAGPSRCGKSTCSRPRSRTPWPRCSRCDDICAIDMMSSLAPAVLPTSPHLRLWRDACEGLALTPDNPEPVRARQGRYLVSLAGAAVSDQADAAAADRLPFGFREVFWREVLHAPHGAETWRRPSATQIYGNMLSPAHSVRRKPLTRPRRVGRSNGGDYDCNPAVRL